MIPSSLNNYDKKLLLSKIFRRKSFFQARFHLELIFNLFFVERLQIYYQDNGSFRSTHRAMCPIFRIWSDDNRRYILKSLLCDVL